jgi:uncharacterized membrane protein
MSTSSAVILALAVFGASAVEMVEALTIVVAAGTTRGWRSALEGAAAAMVTLIAVVGAVGLPLIHYIPLDTIRVVVGTLLLVLGLSWLRKAILRASGHKAPHDEDAIFATTAAGLAATGDHGRGGRDAVGFTVAFKGVFLEGIEVVLVVVSLGATQHRLGLAAVAAGAAALVVTGVGLVVARQLSAVPENTIKTIVGVMLTSFGVFWIGEGAGIHWPGSDLAILVLIGAFTLMTVAMAAVMRTVSPRRAAAEHAPPTASSAAPPPAPPEVSGRHQRNPVDRALRAFGRFWWDLLVGDTPELSVAALAIVAACYGIRDHRTGAVILVPLLVLAVLGVSTYRGAVVR